MVIHALRCSVFYNEAGGANSRATVNERRLLGAIAVFFDRFAEGGLSGTLLFAEGKRAEFWPQASLSESERQVPALSSGAFSVLDPTTTSEDSAAFGIEPVDLAPRISSATQLLHAYELQRAQSLSSLALAREELSPDSGESGDALNRLFSEVNEALYLLPSAVPDEPLGLMFLCGGVLLFGLLQHITLKPGWAATFLNRHDVLSRIAVRICSVDLETRVALPQESAPSLLHWLSPADAVCTASLRPCCNGSAWERRNCYELDAESLEHWCSMHALLGNDLFGTTDSGKTKPTRKSRHARKNRHGKAGRI
jgi:hypothetical protein